MLYFVRHGQTNYNLNKLLAGHTDIELNETGIEQAKKTADIAKDLKIDLIYCSPLKRAKRTCSEINKFHNAKVIIKEELIERSFGKYEGCPYSSVDGVKCWDYYDCTYEKEVESLEKVFKRVYAFLEEIKGECKIKNVLIVAHNDIGRALHCYFNGIPRDGKLLNVSVENAKVIEFNY